MTDDDPADVAVVAYREDGHWAAGALPLGVIDDLDELVAATRRQACGEDAIGFVAVEGDFFVAVRVCGRQVSLLLSDVTAAGESPIAGEVLEALDLPLPGPEDERAEPAGDMAIFADLGLPAMDLAALLGDADLFAEDLIEGIASRLGFGEPFRRALDAALTD